MNITRYLITQPLLVALLLVLLASPVTSSVRSHDSYSSASFSIQGECPASWAEVTGDKFTVRMPQRAPRKPSSLPNVSSPSGDMYRASDGNITYTVRLISYAGYADDKEKLKNYRGLYRESLVRSNEDGGTRMLIKGEKTLDGFTGVQLQIVSAGKRSLLHLYVRGDTVYALEVSPAVEGNAAINCFLNSFRLTQPVKLPPDFTIAGRSQESFPGLPGRETGSSGNLPRWPPPPPPPPPTVYFCECEPGVGKETPGDESNHDIVLPCPMPDMGYTKVAEDHQTYGEGLLSVNFSATGEVVILEVIKGLPHGLTNEAIKAAKKIKFCPAVRNGVRLDVVDKLPFIFTRKDGTLGLPRPITPSPGRRP